MNKEPLSSANSNKEETRVFLNPQEDTNNREITSDGFKGLTKEQVMQYSKNSKWNKIRMALIILLGLFLLACVIAVVLFVIFYPRCPYKPSLNWWQKEIFYQIEVSNFKDSDSDGIGDINGLISKLDYLDNLGVKTLCLSRIISKDTPKDIDPEYGNEDSLKSLKKELGLRSMHLIIDIPANYLDKNDKDIIEFWLKNYADGLRITSFNDEPISRNIDSSNLIDQAIPVEKIDQWSNLVKDISKETFKNKYISFYPSNKNAKQNTIIDERFIVDLDSFKNQSSFVSKISDFYGSLDRHDWPSLLLGNYNSKRIRELFHDNNLSRLIYGLVLLLKGTPILLFGDELELKARFEYEKVMQWDDSFGCGFTNKTDVAEFFQSVTKCENNAKLALAHGAGETLARLYQRLSKLRQEPSFQWGEVKTSDDYNDNVISFVREASGFDAYLIVANTGEKAVTVDYKIKHKIPEKAVVSYFFSSYNSNENLKLDEKVSTDKILIRNGELLVLKFKRAS